MGHSQTHVVATPNDAAKVEKPFMQTAAVGH
jgi:hypothetical protein